MGTLDGTVSHVKYICGVHVDSVCVCKDLKILFVHVGCLPPRLKVVVSSPGCRCTFFGEEMTAVISWKRTM